MAGTVEGNDMWASLRTDIWEIVWLASVVTGLSLIGIVLAVVLAQLLPTGPALSSIQEIAPAIAVAHAHTYLMHA